MHKVISAQNDDFRINLLCCFLSAYYVVLCAINELVNLVFYGVWWDSAFVYAALLLTLFYALPAILKRLDCGSLIFVGVVALLFCSTSILGSGADEVSIRAFEFFYAVLPYFLLGTVIRDFSGLLKMLKKTVRVVIVFASIWLTLALFRHQEEWVNYMRVAYQYLPAVLVSIFAFFESRKLKDFIWLFFSIVLLLFFGTRGPTVFAFLFFCICFFYFSKRRLVKFGGLIIGVSLFIFTIVNFETILLDVNEFLLQRGIVNAAVQKMLYYEDLSNGRFVLYGRVVALLNKRPMIGYGLYADRALLGTYTHSLPLEILLTFGYFFGILILAFLSVKIALGMYRARKDRNMFCIYWVFLTIGVLKLFFSGSYLDEPYFFWLLGLLFPSRRMLLEQKNESRGEH